MSNPHVHLRGKLRLALAGTAAASLTVLANMMDLVPTAAPVTVLGAIASVVLLSARRARRGRRVVVRAWRKRWIRRPPARSRDLKSGRGVVIFNRQDDQWVIRQDGAA
jgi:hypothetical protein